MTFNELASQRLEEIARMLDLLGEDTFKVNAHARAARAIADHAADLKGAGDDPSVLEGIEGVGAKTAAKIAELARTGAIKEHADLAARVPAGLFDVLRVPGLGPKTVRAMWQTLGVTGLDDLQRTIDDDSILSLPRMGAKTVENIKAGIATVRSGAGRVNIGVATPIAEALVARISGVPGVERAAFAGSLRRGRETVGDIDILGVAEGPTAEAAREAFCTTPGVKRVLARGESRCSVELEAGSSIVQADLKLVPARSWGAALMYFTGSKEFNVRVRERALKRGVTLNEYGLFPLDNDPTPHHQRPGGLETAVAGDTEASIFKALELPELAPELRESAADFDHAPPELVTLQDIRAELHAHTTASDGVMSIVQLATLAKSKGFHTVAVTDHSKSSALAGGLSPERLREHIRNVRSAGNEIDGIRILAGSEVDILADGRLDYDDDLLAELDVVVASPHAALTQDPAKATARLLAAVTHPLVHILGHPTGRLIGHRAGLEPNMDEIAAAAAEHQTALEINANWLRLDLRDTHVRLALSKGALIAINCDTHHPKDAENLRYGVATSRRGGLSKERCVNAWTRERLGEWLKR